MSHWSHIVISISQKDEKIVRAYIDGQTEMARSTNIYIYSVSDVSFGVLQASDRTSVHNRYRRKDSIHTMTYD